MLTAEQINTFHMVATCCLANLGSQLAKMEKICDPSYKCLEEKAEYVRMLLSEICGYIPDGEEILPMVSISGAAGGIGDTLQFEVNGVAIMDVYTLESGTWGSNVLAIIAAIEEYSGFTASVIDGIGYLVAPEGSGSEYSDAVVTANTTGSLLVFINENMTTGIDAVENNCIDYDDMEKIMRKIATELNICSPFESLPETTLLTNPCGCC